MTKKKYNYKNKHEITRIRAIVLLIVLVIVCASVPTILLLESIFFPEDKSTEFTLIYEGADTDFGTIDYSGIEYFIDGTSYFTDVDGIITIVMNDFDEHIFQLTWNGITFERVFNSSISEDVVLATKSIDAQLIWDELGIPITGSNFAEIFDLLYYDGNSWILIENATRDANGMIVFSNLIMGTYMVVKIGEIEGFEFIIDQQIPTYTNAINIIPEETIIEVTYTNLVDGVDVPVDLTNIDWAIWAKAQGVWYDLLTTQQFYVYYDLSDIANGRIVIYEAIITDSVDAPVIYEIRIVNTWDIVQPIVIGETIEINLDAKSLEATFLWSSDGTPVDEMDFTLYFNDGVGWISVGVYTTNILGKIIISEQLPIGQYKFDEIYTFDITANDTVKLVEFSVGSVSGKRTILLLGFYS